VTSLRTFARYDRARERYQLAQDDMATFVARFNGNPPETDDAFTFRDLAYLVGLRTERDLAFADFYKYEAQIFQNLTQRVLPEGE
jgi:hypothetical protein